MAIGSRGRAAGVLRGAVRLAIGAGLIAYLLWSNWGKLAELRGRPVRWHFLAVGLAVCLAATLVTFWRWYLLIRAQGLPFRMRDSLRIGFIGYFFNLLIPGAVGGDLVKAVLLAREQRQRATAIATVVIDRIVGLYGLVLVGAAAAALFWRQLAASPELRRLAVWSWSLAGLTSLGMLVLFSNWFRRGPWARWLRRLPAIGAGLVEALEAFAVYRRQLAVLAVALGMSLLGHLGFVLALWCARLAVPGTPPPARVHFMVAPLGLMVGAIPLTPGGLGLAEGAMQKLFEFAGSEGSLALVMMLAFRGMQLAIALLGMAYYLAGRRAYRAERPPAPAG